MPNPSRHALHTFLCLAGLFPALDFALSLLQEEKRETPLTHALHLQQHYTLDWHHQQATLSSKSVVLNSKGNRLLHVQCSWLSPSEQISRGDWDSCEMVSVSIEKDRQFVMGHCPDTTTQHTDRPMVQSCHIGTTVGITEPIAKQIIFIVLFVRRHRFLSPAWWEDALHAHPLWPPHSTFHLAG